MKTWHLTLAFTVAGLSMGLSACTAGSGASGDGDAGPGAGSGVGDGDGDLLIDDSFGSGGGNPLQLEPPAENCGDGIVDRPYEACDDGNREDGDGCWANCLGLDPGFICRDGQDPPQICEPFVRCGDGLMAFPEQCDDGGKEPGDGCNENCKIELGFKCEPGASGVSACSPTTCGDGLVEGAEMCEPDLDPGCTSQCQFAPDCSGDGACTSECGDGLVLGEDCDDGNRLNGDGCDENCQTEPGYDCTIDQGQCEVGATGECILRVPITYRDFEASHPDFEAPECAGGQDIIPGLVQDKLVDGKPVTVSGDECTSHIDEWYQDLSGVNVTVHGELILYETSAGQFVNRYGANGEPWEAPEQNSGDCACGTAGGCEYDGNPLFFPVDDLMSTDQRLEAGLTPDYGVCYLDENTLTWHTNTGPHNFFFTSEVTYWFPYDETTNATLEFNGDDDLWVFVNDQLAVDVGGIHPPKNGAVTISGANPQYGMTPGNVYEIKVFHAERRTKGSTFKLTLSGFNARRSDCAAVCGDGIIGFGEECDPGPGGVSENTGESYNECNADCTLGEFCGDGIVQANEECDDADPAAPDECLGCHVIVVH